MFSTVCQRVAVQKVSVQGGFVSLSIAWAFLRQRELYSSCKEGMEQLMILLGCGDDPLEHLSVCCSAAGEPHTDTVREDALY